MTKKDFNQIVNQIDTNEIINLNAEEIQNILIEAFEMGYDDALDEIKEAFEGIHNEKRKLKKTYREEVYNNCINKLKQAKAINIYKRDRFKKISDLLAWVVDDPGAIATADLVLIAEIAETCSNGDPITVKHIFSIVFTGAANIKSVIDNYIKYRDSIDKK